VLESVTIDTGTVLYPIVTENNQLKFDPRPRTETDARRLQTELGKVKSQADFDTLSAEGQLAWKNRHVVRGCLGSESITPQIYDLKLEPGQIILLASDGYTDNMADDITESFINTKLSEGVDIQTIINTLGQRASNIANPKAGEQPVFRSKSDDITLIGIRVDNLVTSIRQINHPEVNIEVPKDEWELVSERLNTWYALATKTYLDSSEITGQTRNQDELIRLLSRSRHKTNLLQALKLLAKSRDHRLFRFIEQQIQPKI
jgi:hypothetical protein